ncbi:family 92 glycosyl hydrolase [Phialemonium atrogriseum]|uniref:Family 92 glycosyl hydrolase n=1 Tax=Phialemonium atrogriseum TaxID=1093897 RepID=A0AAJ0FCY7_9PEZI|nr:family 92 glycosyl hydrolase [Phialemonium atrogriseum]KAK1762627.1 family 92 glycosyl hydrolase [Phialemonium atrogriseum]
MGGSNADVVLADSYLKGLKGLKNGIDWETGYEAVVSDAEDEPAIWFVEGRGGLASWKALGYIPTDDWDVLGTGPFTRFISRTVEYAYNDFCIAEMAKAMGEHSDAEKYIRRSDNWANMFKADQRSTLNLSTPKDQPNFVDSGFEGFLQPRYLNGTFGHQNPSLCSPLYNFTSCYLNTDGHEAYEGSSWLYTFYVPQDMARLFATLGGPDSFVRRLEYLHTTPNLLYLGDEQDFLLVYLFHYAGRPGLSSRFAHRYIPRQFNDTAAGIPGNDDLGAMELDVYLIVPPFFREVTVTSPATRRTATVRSVGFDDGDGGAYENGVLELTLGRSESDWETKEEDLPPSASTHF